MYHTDVQPLLTAIKNIEKQDLRRALKARGSFYNFVFNSPEPVYVEFYDDLHGPKSALAESVCIKADENIVVSVLADDSELFEIDVDDLYPGMISGLTEAISEKKLRKRRTALAE